MPPQRMRTSGLIVLVASAATQSLTVGLLASEAPTAMAAAHRYVTTLLNLGALRRSDAGLHLGPQLVGLTHVLLSVDDLCPGRPNRDALHRCSHRRDGSSRGG